MPPSEALIWLVRQPWQDHVHILFNHNIKEKWERQTERQKERNVSSTVEGNPKKKKKIDLVFSAVLKSSWKIPISGRLKGFAEAVPRGGCYSEGYSKTLSATW